MKARSEKEYYENKKIQYQNRIAEIETELETKRATVEVTTNRAKEWCEERIESRKKLEVFSKEVNRLEEVLEAQQMSQGPSEIVTKKFKQLGGALEQTTRHIKYMKRNIGFLDEMLKARKKGTDLIRRSTCRNISR